MKSKLPPLGTPTPVLVVDSIEEFEKRLPKKPSKETAAFLRYCVKMYQRMIKS